MICWGIDTIFSEHGFAFLTKSPDPEYSKKMYFRTIDDFYFNEDDDLDILTYI